MTGSGHCTTESPIEPNSCTFLSVLDQSLHSYTVEKVATYRVAYRGTVQVQLLTHHTRSYSPALHESWTRGAQSRQMPCIWAESRIWKRGESPRQAAGPVAEYRCALLALFASEKFGATKRNGPRIERWEHARNWEWIKVHCSPAPPMSTLTDAFRRNDRSK